MIREKYAYGYVERGRFSRIIMFEEQKKARLSRALSGVGSETESEFVLCAYREYLASTIFIGIYV